MKCPSCTPGDRLNTPLNTLVIEKRVSNAQNNRLLHQNKQKRSNVVRYKQHFDHLFSIQQARMLWKHCWTFPRKTKFKFDTKYKGIPTRDGPTWTRIRTWVRIRSELGHACPLIFGADYHENNPHYRVVVLGVLNVLFPLMIPTMYVSEGVTWT